MNSLSKCGTQISKNSLQQHSNCGIFKKDICWSIIKKMTTLYSMKIKTYSHWLINTSRKLVRSLELNYLLIQINLKKNKQVSNVRRITNKNGQLIDPNISIFTSKPRPKLKIGYMIVKIDTYSQLQLTNVWLAQERQKICRGWFWWCRIHMQTIEMCKLQWGSLSWLKTLQSLEKWERDYENEIYWRHLFFRGMENFRDHFLAQSKSNINYAKPFGSKMPQVQIAPRKSTKSDEFPTLLKELQVSIPQIKQTFPQKPLQ